MHAERDDWLAEHYLRLMKLSLIGLAGGSPYTVVRRDDGTTRVRPLDDESIRLAGGDWPADGLTMIGMKRLENLQDCVEQALHDEFPGDLIETGVWRGGAAIFMRALLKLHGVSDRVVYAADSFAGFPEPDAERYPADAPRLDRKRHAGGLEYVTVPFEAVQENFRRYGMLDDQVRLVKGWFRDTLPPLAGHPWALIRLDGDFYESTMVALESLYPDLSPGGFAIIDDYNLRACKAAVDDFRDAHGVEEAIQPIDGSGVYWRKER